jgi:hypothetical protein
MVEWGNNGLKQSAKRLGRKLSIDDERNLRIEKLFVLLYNWRVSTCPRSQIETFFRIQAAENLEAEALGYLPPDVAFQNMDNNDN